MAFFVTLFFLYFLGYRAKRERKKNWEREKKTHEKIKIKTSYFHIWMHIAYSTQTKRPTATHIEFANLWNDYHTLAHSTHPFTRSHVFNLQWNNKWTKTTMESMMARWKRKEKHITLICTSTFISNLCKIAYACTCVCFAFFHSLPPPHWAPSSSLFHLR